MKPTLLKLTAILLILAGVFTSCKETPDTPFIEDDTTIKCGIIKINDEEYLKMCTSPKQVSINSSTTLKLILENHTKEEMFWGQPYRLEHYNGSDWIPIKLNVNFELIGYILKPLEIAEQQFFLSDMNSQTLGKYRVIKNVNLGAQVYVIYAEFEIIKNQ